MPKRLLIELSREWQQRQGIIARGMSFSLVIALRQRKGAMNEGIVNEHFVLNCDH